ncbi:MAG: hypothetical protein COZ05_14550 [Armatimonadetes bacterium CG_4_10_14_3_um_filter_59_10]|nr:MAG: hypothetical protein COZ05_14550 [Armatimonadetes bacterium CG_4_10_14_3_um_filter_59_10]
MVTASFVLLWRLCRSVALPPTLITLAIAMGVCVARGRLDARPELFSGLLLAVLLLELGLFKVKQKTHLWRLPFVFLLWTNLHGGVVTGWFILLIAVAGELMTWLLRNRFPGAIVSHLHAGQLRHLAGIALLSFAVTFINPYGIAYFSSISPNPIAVFSKHIVEWFPLSQFLAGCDPEQKVAFAVMGAILAFSVLRRPLDIGQILIVGFMVLSVAHHQRQRWVAVQIVCYAMAVAYGMHSQRMSDRRPLQWWRSTSCAGGTTAILCALLLAGERSVIEQNRRHGFGIDNALTPVGAVLFAKQQNLKGNVFNVLGDSGYLCWELVPQTDLFIDPTNAYPPSLFDDEEVATTGNMTQRVALLKRWNIEWAVLSSESSIYGPLGIHLQNDPGWILVYWDGVSVVYVRDLSKYAKLIRECGYRFADPTAPQRAIPAGSQKVWAEEVQRAARCGSGTFKFHNTAGTMMCANGYTDAGQWYYSQSLQMRALNPQGLLGLAQVHYVRNQTREAARTLRCVILLQPSNATAWGLRGFMLNDEGKYGCAIKSFQRSVDLGTSNDAVFRVLQELLLNSNRFREAIPYLQRSTAQNPEDLALKAQLVVALVAVQRYPEARRILRQMLKMNPASPSCLFILSVVLTHDIPPPREEILKLLKKAVALEPGMRNLIRAERRFAPFLMLPEFEALL